MAAKAKAMSRWRFRLSHMAFKLPGAEDSFEEKKYTTAAYLRKYTIVAAPSSRHKIALALTSSKRYLSDINRMPILLRLRIARQIVEGRLSAVQSGPFFIAETGTPFTAAHVGHYLLARRDKLPISKFTTHDLRRTVATMLAEMGIALDLVAAVVGHEAGGRETRTLVRHYVRTDLVERKKTVLEAWHRRLREIIEGQTARGNVTRLEDAKDPAVA
jgi:hypothetical protein